MLRVVRAVGLAGAITGGVLAMLLGCSSPQVQYGDPEATETMTIDFGSTDLQQIAETMINDLNTFSIPVREKSGADKRSFILLTKVRNKTSEHIDTKNITDKIRTALLRGGRFRFVTEREQRDELLSEHQYAESGAVDPASAKKFGRQIGADYILFGEITSIEKKVDRQKDVWYKITMNLEDIETGELVWANDREIRKTRQ